MADDWKYEAIYAAGRGTHNPTTYGDDSLQLTHVRAALVEIGRTDLSEIAFHNRKGHPAFDWCRFVANDDGNRGLMPNIVDVIHVLTASRMWYLTFMPEHPRASLDIGDRYFDLVDITRSVQRLWLRHRSGECQCPPRDYGRSPKRTNPGVR